MKSTESDYWSSKVYYQLASKGGNIRVNAIYEAKLSPMDKITHLSPDVDVKQFVSDKYKQRLWYSTEATGNNVIGDDDDSDSDDSSDW